MHQIRQNARPTIRERREKREPRSERERDDRADERTAPTSGAVHDRDRRSSGAIDDRDQRACSSLVDRRVRSSDNRIARQSMSGAIDERCASDERACRSTNGAIVNSVARRTSVLPDLMHFLVKCLNEPNTKINFP